MATLPLVAVDPVILSSYQAAGGTGGPRPGLIPLHKLKGGIAAPEVATALLRAHQVVTAAGGDFRITDCHRDAAVQAAARARYDAWVKAGKPKPPGSGQKAAFVAVPGKSNHNGGRAIDVDIASLRFPGVAPDKQLDKLWELLIPVGWRPIIKEAREGASESWHFDYPGQLIHARALLPYDQSALVGALLVGHGGEYQQPGYLLQALCWWHAVNCGPVDGVVGSRTWAAVEKILGHRPGSIEAAIRELG